MKIGRNLGIALAVLVAILVAGVIFLLPSLDSNVAGAIEKYGSQVTQTPVQVSSISIDLKSGTGTINELRVGNPDGFSAPHILTLGGISTRIDTATVTQDPVIIDTISINAPRVVYEINKAGSQGVASEMRACGVAPLARTASTVLRGAPCRHALRTATRLARYYEIGSS